MIHNESSIENSNYANGFLIIYSWTWTVLAILGNPSESSSTHCKNLNPVRYKRYKSDNYTVIVRRFCPFAHFRIIIHGIWLQQHFELNLTQNFWNSETLNQKYTLKWFFIQASIFIAFMIE